MSKKKPKGKKMPDPVIEMGEGGILFMGSANHPLNQMHFRKISTAEGFVFAFDGEHWFSTPREQVYYIEHDVEIIRD